MITLSMFCYSQANVCDCANPVPGTLLGLFRRIWSLKRWLMSNEQGSWRWIYESSLCCFCSSIWIVFDQARLVVVNHRWGGRDLFWHLQKRQKVTMMSMSISTLILSHARAPLYSDERCHCQSVPCGGHWRRWMRPKSIWKPRRNEWWYITSSYWSTWRLAYRRKSGG